MKVIHFVPYFPPERLGGVGECVAGLHEALRAAGHTSLVVTTGQRSGDGVERISRRPLGWFFKTATWARRARGFDIVHCQAGEALPVLLALCFTPRRGRPKILTTFHVDWSGIATAHRPYTIEGQTFARTLRAFIYRTLIAWIHRVFDHLAIHLSDAVNTISLQSARDVLGSDGPERTSIIYYGLAELAPQVQEIPEITPVDLLYAGSGGHRKRVVTLPFLLEAIRRERPEARLRIVGFTPESEPEVTDLLRQKGLLEQVDFVGVKTSKELPPYYAKARVLVVPSAYEGLPFVILEAMRSALPVVATRVSGHPEALIDGENGFLVDLDCPQQMAERCLELLRSPELAERLGVAARQTFEERFTLERQTTEYLSLYSSLTSLPPPAKPSSTAREVR
jgi:glycosyltransferase involved in cell wall biosynthesis